MSKKQPRHISRDELSTPVLLFREWQDAAKEWRRLQSDPAEARCRVARAAYFQAAWGYVPLLGAEMQCKGDKIA